MAGANHSPSQILGNWELWGGKELLVSPSLPAPLPSPSLPAPLPFPSLPAPLQTVHSLLKRAGIWASGTLLTGVPIGAWLDADTAATFAVAPAAAQQPVAGHAGVGAGCAVAVEASPVGVTHAVPAVALAMAYK